MLKTKQPKRHNTTHHPTTTKPKSKPTVTRSATKARHLSTTTTTTQSQQQIEPPTATTPADLKRKRWAITWGQSSANGLGRPSKLDFDPHPQRVILPSLAGEGYAPYSKEFELFADIPEEGIADVAQITSGWSTTLAATSEGRVFQWGFRGPTRAMVKRTQADKSDVQKSIGSFFETVVGYHPWSAGSPKPTRLPCFGAETDEQLKEEAQVSGVELPKWMTAKRMKPVKLSTDSDNRGVLTSGGHLFTWSEVGDIYGSIGQGREYSASPEPRLIPIPNIVDFAFGYNHLSFVTSHGTLYSCGNTDGGATGLPMAFVNLKAKKKRIFRPLSVHTNYEKFTSDILDASKTHLIDTPSTPFDPTTGKKDNDKGAASNYTVGNEKKTKKIDMGQFAIEGERGLNPKTTSGTTENDSHEAMRMTGNVLLSNIVQFVNWKGVEGKEGSVDPVNMLLSGQIPPTLPKFKSVACGFAHTITLDENGQVWSHGRNAHGELGHTLNPMDGEGRGDAKSHQVVNDGLNPVDFRCYYFPSKITSISHLTVTKVSAGLHHSAVLTKDGEVFTFGNNEFGQCGRLNELPSTLRSVAMGAKQPWALAPGKLYVSPNVLNGAKIIDVTCGYYDTAITLSDGRCLMAGGYLSKEGHPRSLFTLSEFDPLVKQQQAQGDDDGESGSEWETTSEEYDHQNDPNNDPNNDHNSKYQPNTWIQSVPSRDMIPRSMYSKMHKIEMDKVLSGKRKEFGLTSDERYFMKSVSFGWHHMSATAIPRTRLTSSTQIETSIDGGSVDGEQQHGEGGEQQQGGGDGAEVTQIDQTLLDSPEADQHHQASEQNYKTSSLDVDSDLKLGKK